MNTRQHDGLDWQQPAIGRAGQIRAELEGLYMSTDASPAEAGSYIDAALRR